MAKENILIVEDEEDILELIRYNLTKEGYTVATAMSGEDALVKARQQPPDLVLLDIMLPGIDGLEVCRSLKSDAKTSAVPIVMLTAKSEEADIVTGLELGADDYIAKPFSPKVLVARIRTVLRRKSHPPTQEDATIAIHGLTIVPGRHEVLAQGKSITLTLTEFRILHYLSRHPGWVFSRDKIIEAVHGSDYPVTDRSIDVQIVGLRKKLGEFGEIIETVRGIGYRFKE